MLPGTTRCIAQECISLLAFRSDERNADCSLIGKIIITRMNVHSDRSSLGIKFNPIHHGAGIALEMIITDPIGFKYFKLQYDSGERILKFFELNGKKVEKARRTSGFFSIMTHKLDMDAMQTYRTYRLRDEQEKAFQLMKG